MASQTSSTSSQAQAAAGKGDGSCQSDGSCPLSDSDRESDSDRDSDRESDSEREADSDLEPLSKKQKQHKTATTTNSTHPTSSFKHKFRDMRRGDTYYNPVNYELKAANASSAVWTNGFKRVYEINGPKLVDVAGCEICYNEAEGGRKIVWVHNCKEGRTSTLMKHLKNVHGIKANGIETESNTGISLGTTSDRRSSVKIGEDPSNMLTLTMTTSIRIDRNWYKSSKLKEIEDG